MNKNNFFVKFAYFYRCKIIGVRDKIIDIKDGIIEMLVTLCKLLVYIFILIILTVEIFIPVQQLIACFISKYMSGHDIKKLGVNKPAGYYTKWSIKRIADNLPKEAV